MATIQEKVYGLHPQRESLMENYREAKKDPSFQALIKKLQLKDDEAMKITSKLQDTLEELKHCQNCKGLFTCQNSYAGHVNIPEQKEGKLYFTYTPCKYQRKFLQEKKEKEKRALKNLYVRMKDITLNDKKQAKVIKWIDQFYSSYSPIKDMKGLYLYGSFGSGKTFLIYALFNELKITKRISVEMVYFPEILRTLKEDWELYESRIHRYQTVELLLLDDIGAEKVTEWGRDEVLGTILQYRMEHNYPTFFTSNMTLEELENHLANIGGKIDKVKSRRIIERIKQLSEPMELISENRRV